MGGIPVDCGIHRCSPAECFVLHYPTAHRPVEYVRILQHIAGQLCTGNLEYSCIHCLASKILEEMGYADQ